MVITRRQFLKNSLLITFSLSAGISGLTNCGKSKTSGLTNLGLILGTIKTEMEKDYITALEKVASLGYQYLEFGAHYGPSIEEFNALLDQLGLKALAGGSSIYHLQNSLDEHIKNTIELRKKYLVCYWPWTDSAENKTLDDWKRVADSLNDIGEKCQQQGLKFAYHNHDIEFKRTGGKIPFDVLLEYTDPQFVTMELDLYWITKGNQNPIPYLQNHPDRFELFHIKDMDNTPERSFACVGQGIIDFPTIFREIKQIDRKYFIVEHDRPQHPMQCIEQSIRYLKNFEF